MPAASAGIPILTTALSGLVRHKRISVEKGTENTAICNTAVNITTLVWTNTARDVDGVPHQRV